MKKEPVQEVIFIGLPGPTHHYGGLSPDNVASDTNRGRESNPRQAALQVLELARYLLSLGIPVALLPPHQRPHLPLLQGNGYSIETAPLELLEMASSSSFMWAANAATAIPVCDSSDGNLHIFIANLHSNQHRRIEAQTTYHNFLRIFADIPDSIIHPPLPAADGFLDEGAANHMRFSGGFNVFVYGGRQNLAASKEVAAGSHIPPQQVSFVEQNPEVISAGVFHNDVIAVNHENLLLIHEKAYKNGFSEIKHPDLQLIIISDDDLTVDEAVHSYFFNSQIVTTADGKMVVIAPQELKTLYHGKAAKLMEKICNSMDNQMDEVSYLDLRQSMRNGGGPACLRLRVPMTDRQIEALATTTNILATTARLTALEGLIHKYYPQTLRREELRNRELYINSQEIISSIF